MSVNILPPQIKQEKETGKKIRRSIFYVFLLTILLLVIGGGLYLYNLELGLKIQNLNSRQDQLAKDAKQYEQVATQIATINKKLTKIDDINKNRIIWSLILSNMARSTPTQVKLSTLSLDKSTKKVTMTGEAESRMEIARFKEKLESSDYFKNVIFSSSSHNQQEDNFTFNLTAELEKTN